MPPMPQMRRQGGFGRNPMGGPFGRQAGFQGPPRSPFMGQMNPMQRQPSRGGGLLARLFGKSPQGQAVAGRGVAAGTGGTGAGSILQTLGNPDAINTFLANTQNVLNTAQQFGPLIEQYGPLFRNLPAMWKLYRGLKNSDDKNETQTKESSGKEKPIGSSATGPKNRPPAKIEGARKKVADEEDSPPSKSHSENIEESRGVSRPKLFF